LPYHFTFNALNPFFDYKKALPFLLYVQRLDSGSVALSALVPLCVAYSAALPALLCITAFTPSG
jgi:hypothetical protein